MERASSELAPVDLVLLIDGDNDPHLPADFPITDHTLVRVFIRPGAKMPRGLERRVGALPKCVAVYSSKGGANAADFVMSLHAGLLHATLPIQVPFTLVTNDKTLAAMVQELQRLGRQATLWTSHPEASAPPAREGRRQGSRRGRGRTAARGGESGASPSTSVPRSGAARGGASAASLPPQEKGPSFQRDGKTLERVAAAYAARIAKMKDPPSRLKALLNDIKNRAVNSAFPPEDILEQLKRSHGVEVDERGRVRRRL